MERKKGEGGNEAKSLVPGRRGLGDLPPSSPVQLHRSRRIVVVEKGAGSFTFRPKVRAA
jgi:hypothetical protein